MCGVVEPGRKALEQRDDSHSSGRRALLVGQDCGSRLDAEDFLGTVRRLVQLAGGPAVCRSMRGRPSPLFGVRDIGAALR